MDRLVAAAQAQPVAALATLLALGFVTSLVYSWLSNIYLHPLASFPGPRVAAATACYKAYVEVVAQRSWHLELQALHNRYGDVVRVGPNELHFRNPKAYHDIYNNKNRWDKEASLYHSFGEDRSSFGFLTYEESKPRKDVLNKSFSAKAIAGARGLVQDKVDALCDAFARVADSGQASDLAWAYRAMTMDIITYYSFGTSVDAINEPGFRAPILVAMDASLPVFIMFKHSSLYKNMIINCPPNISRVVSPATAGLVDLQQILSAQIDKLYTNTSQSLDLLPHGNTIYHQLLDKESHRNGTVPSPGSLYEEGQALMFAGADTVGNTLMLATFQICRNPVVMARLKEELRAAIPNRDAAPSYPALEKLPYLNACLKEALRMASGVISGLPRHVPAAGATIAGQVVPPTTVVSIGSTFVHYNATLFPDPHTYTPERWLDAGAGSLDDWLVAFSRGPRACLGINLAWVELRLALATVLRRFDVSLDADSPKALTFREAFLPMFEGKHVQVRLARAAS